MTARQKLKPRGNILEGTECCQPPCELVYKPFPAKLSDEITAPADLLTAVRDGKQRAEISLAWTLDPKNCEIVNMCCLKALNCGNITREQ